MYKERGIQCWVYVFDGFFGSAVDVKNEMYVANEPARYVDGHKWPYIL